MNTTYLGKVKSHNHISQHKQGKHPLTLVYETGPQRAAVDESIIQIALSGPALVMDAGNCFNPLRLVRSIRRQTLRINQVLENIQIARAFTCFQVVALLEQTRDPQGPIFILRPLTTFQDEMAQVHERIRLLGEVDRHISRLQKEVAVTVMVKESRLLDAPLIDWLTALQDRADEVVFPSLPKVSKPATFIYSG